MKKLIVIMYLIFCGSAYAQSITSDTAKAVDYKVIEEEYLANLFKNADIVFCKIDTINGIRCVKNMEVAFNDDSSLFSTAFIESDVYNGPMTAFYRLSCTYVVLNDIDGNEFRFAYQKPSVPMEFDEQPLNDFDILKPILDSLLQKTAIVDNSKDTRIFVDLDQDWCKQYQITKLRSSFFEEFFYIDKNS